MSARSEIFAIPKRAVRGAGYVLVAALAAIVVALAVSAIAQRLSPGNAMADAINPHEYQAVFLSNSDVFFGKLTAPASDFYYLRHAYRLTAQPAGKGQQLQRKLVRVTSDIHGPEDLLVINRAQVLYIENLSPSGAAARSMNQGAP